MSRTYRKGNETGREHHWMKRGCEDTRIPSRRTVKMITLAIAKSTTTKGA